MTVSYTYLHSFPNLLVILPLSLVFCSQQSSILISFLYPWWFQYLSGCPIKKPQLPQFLDFCIPLPFWSTSVNYFTVTPSTFTSLKKYKSFWKFPIEAFNSTMAASYVFSGHNYFPTTTQLFSDVGTSDPLLLPLSYYPPVPSCHHFPSCLADSVTINMLPLCKYFQLSVPSLPQLSSRYKTPIHVWNPLVADFLLVYTVVLVTTDHIIT